MTRAGCPLVPEASGAAETKTMASQRQCHRNSKVKQQKRRRGRPALVPSAPVSVALPLDSLRDDGGAAT